MSDQGNVVRFPTQLRNVPIKQLVPSSGSEVGLQLVDHDGRLYALRNLLTRLPPVVRDELAAGLAQTGQEAWDVVVRRWPDVAEQVVADAHAVPWHSA